MIALSGVPINISKLSVLDAFCSIIIITFNHSASAFFATVRILRQAGGFILQEIVIVSVNIPHGIQQRKENTGLLMVDLAIGITG